MKQTFAKLKEKLPYNNRAFNTPQSIIKQLCRINKEIEDLNNPVRPAGPNMLTQMVPPNKSRIFLFLKCAFFRTDHVLAHKVSQQSLRQTIVIFSNHNSRKLEINSRRKTG